MGVNFVTANFAEFLFHALRRIRAGRRAEALDPGLTEPVLEAGLGESGVLAGHECALLQFYAEVARLRIGDHFAWIAAFPEVSSDEFVQTGRRGRSPTSLQEGLRRAHRDLAGGDGSVADLGGVCKELYGFR